MEDRYFMELTEEALYGVNGGSGYWEVVRDISPIGGRPSSSYNSSSNSDRRQAEKECLELKKKGRK